jgi:hypothetical protein
MGAPEEQIRRAAGAWIAMRWPHVRVLHEVGLEHGQVRADIVTLTPEELHGFELKSHADKIRRLPEQVRVYGETMDRATLVVSYRLFHAAQSIVPAWWGLCLFRDTRPLEVVRDAAVNPAPTGLTTARLLWRDEALELLRESGRARGLAKAPRLRLYQELLKVVPADELRGRIRRRLLARPDWKPTG